MGSIKELLRCFALYSALLLQDAASRPTSQSCSLSILGSPATLLAALSRLCTVGFKLNNPVSQRQIFSLPFP